MLLYCVSLWFVFFCRFLVGLGPNFIQGLKMITKIRNVSRERYFLGILALITAALLFSFGCVPDEPDEPDEPVNHMKKFNECLAEEGMVIYGSAFCPACTSLVETLGGHEAARPVYVECTEEEQRCAEESKTSYVPEVQIDGELYEGPRTLEDFSRETGCPLPN